MNYVEYITNIEGIKPSQLNVNYTDNFINGIDIKINEDEEFDPLKCKIEILFILNNNYK